MLNVRIEGKRIWITGASSGIGESLAYVLAERGANLVLSARRESVLEELRQSLSRPDDHHVVPLDLTVGDPLEALAQEVEKTLGPIQALINNGGVSQRGLAADTTMDVVRRIFETNFFGAVALTRGVLPGMLERRSGHIVVVSSVVGKFGTPMRSSYSASKHALHGYFDALRLEVEDHGIGVTLVCPGYVRTRVSQNALGADGMRNLHLDRGERVGTSPEATALRIVRSMEREEKEIYFGGREVLGVYLKRLAPGLLERITKNVNRPR